MFGYYPQKSKLKIFTEFFCLSKKEVFRKLPVQNTGRTGPSLVPECGFPVQGLSQYLETGCPNRGFIDFGVSKVWYKIHVLLIR